MCFEECHWHRRDLEPSDECANIAVRYLPVQYFQMLYVWTVRPYAAYPVLRIHSVCSSLMPFISVSGAEDTPIFCHSIVKVAFSFAK
jgi:hypothetical protein